jgi:condensin complex subunit 1
MEEQVALTRLAHDEILQLQLKLKYLKEALKFIHQIELGMEQIEKLLGSTSKAEVLEAMDFYREASLYKIPKTEASPASSN